MFYKLCSKHLLWFVVLVGLLAVSCSSGGDTPTPAEEASTSDSQILNFYNWDTYIDPKIITDFENEFNVTINYEIYDDDADMRDDVIAGNVAYDLVVPSEVTLSEMRLADLLYTLRKENIPNMDNIDPQFVNPAHDPGNRHCVPYQWGTIGIAYNVDAIEGEITSIADFFDPAYAGRVGMFDSPRSSISIVLLYLGYSPNTTDFDQIREAADFLKDHADHIGAYTGDDAQDLLVDGELDMVFEWSGDVFQVMEEYDNIVYVIPSEGSILWTDSICIPKTVQNRDLAEKFINYLLEPEVGAALSTYVQYGSPNIAAIPLLSEEDRNNTAIYPPPEVRERLYFEVPLQGEVEAFHNQVWEEVIADYQEKNS